MNKYLLPYDIFERHKKIGSLIHAGDVVLDVGGELAQLSRFSKAQKILVANLQGSQEKSDIIIKKGKLPFKDSFYSTVCAIDVLEHIPKKDRLNFANELYRVCKNRTILSFPIGTTTHINYEKELRDWLKTKGTDVTYLDEHINLGLPTTEEIEAISKGKEAIVSYSGQLQMSELLFKMHIFDPHIKFIRKLIYFSKLAFNLLTNEFLYAFLSNKKYSQQVVRAYVVLEKSQK